MSGVVKPWDRAHECAVLVVKEVLRLRVVVKQAEERNDLKGYRSAKYALHDSERLVRMYADDALWSAQSWA